MKSNNSRNEVGGLTCAKAFHIIFGLRAKRVARERVSEGQTWKGFLAIKSPFAFRLRAWRYPSNGELCCSQATCGLASLLARYRWSRSLTERGSLLSSLLSRSACVHDDIPRMENSVAHRLLAALLRHSRVTGDLAAAQFKHIDENISINNSLPSVLFEWLLVLVFYF